MFFSIVCFAQSHLYSVKFSYEIESELAEEKMRPGKAGLLYSLIGDYQSSIKFNSQKVSWGVDSLDLSAYHIGNAFDNIIEPSINNHIRKSSQASA